MDRLRALSILIFSGLLLLSALSGCSKVKLNNANKPAEVAAVAALSRVKLGSVLPLEGPIAGGTLITLNGEGFFEGVQVLVGGKPCLEARIISPTALSCITPPSDESAADITLTVPNGTPVVLASAFTYFKPSSPASGFAITSGGGVLTGTGMVMQSSIGEPAYQAVSVGTGMTLVTGIHATTP